MRPIVAGDRLRFSAAIVAAGLLLAGCIHPPPSARRTQPVLLAVVTWNMDRAAGDLARLLSDLRSGRLTGAAGVPIVLLLQETTEQVVGEASAGNGARPLSMFFTPVLAGRTRTTGNAILSTVPLRATRSVPLPEERQPRAAAVASIDVAGQELFVASVHLENRLGWLRGLFGDLARRRQAEALIGSLPSGRHGIVGGDMNTMLGPSEAALDVLRDRFDDTPDEPLEPTFGDRLILDHLFFDVPDGWTVTRRVIEDRYGSDHHPVLGLLHADRSQAPQGPA